MSGNALGDCIIWMVKEDLHFWIVKSFLKFLLKNVPVFEHGEKKSKFVCYNIL